MHRSQDEISCRALLLRTCSRVAIAQAAFPAARPTPAALRHRRPGRRNPAGSRAGEAEYFSCRDVAGHLR
ncbi:MAG TPA: hypothetical protein VKD26_12125 [Streptosporangiaceae bacterium]|nr:hypothetical protein [Streptosporangiaceae bacterium]